MSEHNGNEPPRGGRGVVASVVALLAAIGALVVLTFVTSSDAPDVRVPQDATSAERLGAAPSGSPSQIEAHLREGNALVDTALDAKLAALGGVPVVVNQWASWCPPCRAEFPFFAELAERYRERVAFVGLNSRDERGAAEAFLEKHAVNYPSVYDETGDQARSIGAGASWPTTVFDDAEGTAVFIRRGSYVDATALEADIRQHALGGR
jgi:thiol-disulfide isomerase/thioredoxin